MASRVSVRRVTVGAWRPRRLLGALVLHLAHSGRTSTAGPLTRVTAKNSTHHDAERERDGDRTLAAALELRLGEDDAFWFVFLVH